MMSRRDFGAVLAVLSAGIDFAIDDAKLAVWYDLLGDLPRDALRTGVRRFLIEDGQFPTPTKIRRYAIEAMDGETPSWETAFGRLLEAIRHHGYWGTSDGMASLDNLTRQTVRALGGWRVICDADADTLPMLRAHFRDMFSNLANRQQRDRLLPAELRPRLRDDRERDSITSDGRRVIATDPTTGPTAGPTAIGELFTFAGERPTVSEIETEDAP